jgi:hypothetical protein
MLTSTIAQRFHSCHSVLPKSHKFFLVCKLRGLVQVLSACQPKWKLQLLSTPLELPPLGSRTKDPASDYSRITALPPPMPTEHIRSPSSKIASRH